MMCEGLAKASSEDSTLILMDRIRRMVRMEMYNTITHQQANTRLERATLDVYSE